MCKMEYTSIELKRVFNNNICRHNQDDCISDTLMNFMPLSGYRFLK